MPSQPLLPPEILDYADRSTTPSHELYDALVRETQASTLVPGMQLGRVEGRLLTLLVQVTGARRILELGTFTGYSALSLAEGLPDDGTLLTCDINEETAAVAQRFFDRAPWGHKIQLHRGAASELLERLEGPFDLAFLDADKPRYIEYWEALVPLIRPGGLVVIDNVLWAGTVLEPKTRGARAVAAFNDHIRADPRVDTVLLTIRDGMTLARKL